MLVRYLPHLQKEYNYRMDGYFRLNDRVFRDTGRMMEKYNVVDTDLPAGGGEYPNQDGFGWTNGVYLCLQTNGR